jgi:hypothetical protein
MSRVPEAAPSRPSLVDALFLLAGCALSLYLIPLNPLAATPAEDPPGPVAAALLAFLPGAMRLPEGILLLWPVFFATRRLLGRREALTGGEWLWVLSWVGVAALAGLDAWGVWGSPPAFLHTRPRLLWYMIFVPAMSALAAVLALAGLVRRRYPPWTHLFGLALVLWPALPLALILALGRFV